MREFSPRRTCRRGCKGVRSGVADRQGPESRRAPDPPCGIAYRIGASPAPNAVKMRVSGRITGATSGKSPTGS